VNLHQTRSKYDKQHAKINYKYNNKVVVLSRNSGIITTSKRHIIYRGIHMTRTTRNITKNTRKNITRFTAEAIAENAYDENIIADHDEHIEVDIIPSELDMDKIREYITYQHGSVDLAQDDIDISFIGVDMTSSTPITVYWEV